MERTPAIAVPCGEHFPFVRRFSGKGAFGVCRVCFFPEEQGGGYDRQTRGPYPAQFREHDGKPPFRQERLEAERRNPDRPPAAEVPGLVKGPERRYAQPAVGHGVQQDMA